MAVNTLIQTTDPAYPVRAGALAMRALMQNIKAVSDETCDPDADNDRDYFAITECVSKSLATNLTNSDQAHREGYLRAIADILCMAADGVSPGENWDPIGSTKWSFAGRGRLELDMSGESNDMTVSGERLEYSLEAVHELAHLFDTIETAINEEGEDASNKGLIRRTRAVMTRTQTLIHLLQGSLGDSVVSDDQIKHAFGPL